MILLHELKTYLDNKRIALIGNATSILDGDYGGIIDLHDIVIRMNHAIVGIEKDIYFRSIGKRTDIYIPNMNQEGVCYNMSIRSKAKYIALFTRWHNDPNKRETGLLSKLDNLYLGDKSEFDKLRKEFDIYKPSTGATIFNFLIKNIKFKELNIYGFDFFKSATKDVQNRNVFKSFLYKDHSAELEKKFFEKYINKIDNIKNYS